MPKPTCTLVDAWQCMKPAEADEVRAFWLREQADIGDEETDRRITQILTRVLDDDGRLVAVSTAQPRTIPRLRQPMFYYRCFIGSAWRNRNLVRPLLRHGFDILERWSRQRDFPCIGVLLELENEGFAHALQQAHWPTTGFTFIGRSARGLDLRVCYFRGARLKAPR